MAKKTLTEKEKICKIKGIIKENREMTKDEIKEAFCILFEILNNHL